jgi:hypothetical protein
VSINLIDNWKYVASKAMSMRFVLLAGVLSGIEVILPLFVDSIPRGIFAGLSLVAAVSGAISRVVAQPKMHKSE